MTGINSQPSYSNHLSNSDSNVNADQSNSDLSDFSSVLGDETAVFRLSQLLIDKWPIPVIAPSGKPDYTALQTYLDANGVTVKTLDNNQIQFYIKIGSESLGINFNAQSSLAITLSVAPQGALQAALASQAGQRLKRRLEDRFDAIVSIDKPNTLTHA